MPWSRKVAIVLLVYDSFRYSDDLNKILKVTTQVIILFANKEGKQA